MSTSSPVVQAVGHGAEAVRREARHGDVVVTFADGAEVRGQELLVATGRRRSPTTLGSGSQGRS